MSLPFSPGIHPSVLAANEDELRRVFPPENEREEFLHRVIEWLSPLAEINTITEISDLDPEDREQVMTVADALRDKENAVRESGDLRERLRVLRLGVKGAYLEGAAIASVEGRLEAILARLQALIKDIDSRYP
ncbi:MAG: hypothetical protein ABFE07_00380 [Armatimonadia bacterium]